MVMVRVVMGVVIPDIPQLFDRSAEIARERGISRREGPKRKAGRDPAGAIMQRIPVRKQLPVRVFPGLDARARDVVACHLQLMAPW